MANASSAAGSKATLPELTLRGVIIGGLITLIFTAANVYLGAEGGLDLCYLHPGCRDFHGGAAPVQGS